MSFFDDLKQGLVEVEEYLKEKEEMSITLTKPTEEEELVSRLEWELDQVKKALDAAKISALHCWRKDCQLPKQKPDPSWWVVFTSGKELGMVKYPCDPNESSGGTLLDTFLCCSDGCAVKTVSEFVSGSLLRSARKVEAEAAPSQFEGLTICDDISKLDNAARYLSGHDIFPKKDGKIVKLGDGF